MYTLGIDIGSTTSKCAVIKDGTELVDTSLQTGGLGTGGPEEALAALWRYRAVAVKQFGGVTGDLAGWFLQRAELWMLAALLLSGRWLG